MKKKELAGVVIYDTKGKLLLIHRNTSSLTQWEMPGGKVEENEVSEQAAKREALEELGVTVEVVRYLGSATFEHTGIMWNYNWFLAEMISSDAPIINEPEIFDDLKYWDVDELRQMENEISPNVFNYLKTI